MSNKFIRVIVATAAFLVFGFCIYTFIVVNTSAASADPDELQRYLSSAQGIDEAEIIKVEEAEGYLGVLYRHADQTALLLLQKNFLNRYAQIGGAQGSGDINLYNVNIAGRRTITIVYGRNKNRDAYAYEFYNDGRLYTQSELGEAVLDMYVIQPSENVSGVLSLWNQYGGKIQ